MNIILDNSWRKKLSEEIEIVRKMPSAHKKYPEADVQQAWTLHEILKRPSGNIFCVGSKEDTTCEYLSSIGRFIDWCDSDNGLSVEQVIEQHPEKIGRSNIVFSTSVIEHVKDEIEFIDACVKLLAPGGLLLFTCDFKRDWKVGDSTLGENCFRFYSQERLYQITSYLKKQGFLFDSNPLWAFGEEDFELGGIKYAFATISMVKNA